jgi:hypothetical protein
VYKTTLNYPPNQKKEGQNKQEKKQRTRRFFHLGYTSHGNSFELRNLIRSNILVEFLFWGK